MGWRMAADERIEGWNGCRPERGCMLKGECK